MSAIQTTQLGSSPCTGSIHVTILRAYELPGDNPSRKYFATVKVDDVSGSTQDSTEAAGWDKRFSFEAFESSILCIEVYRRRRFHSDVLIGSFKEERLERILTDSYMVREEITRPLQLDETSNQATPAGHIILKVDLEDNKTGAMAAMVQRAKIRASLLQRSQSVGNSHLLSGLQSVDDVSLDTIKETWAPLLSKLAVFSNIADSVSEVHPYAQAAYRVISAAYKLVVAQMQRDINILLLVDAMNDVYDFVKEAEPLRTVKSHEKVMLLLAQQTTECGYFISAYCNDDFFTRTLKHAVAPTDAAIVEYGNKFSELKAALLAHATINTEISVLRVLDIVERVEIKLDLLDLPYARGARFHGGKRCLPGTRQALLTRLKEWVDGPDPKEKGVLILVGDKETGKSAIAHSISHHYHGLRRLGSSVFVDSAKEAAETRMPLRFFPTIAQDLATLDPQYRYKLWDAIKADRALRNALDPTDQLQSFILAPFIDLALAGPIILVIDGLENCDDKNSLGQFLAVLAARVSKLPSNFRILLTTRPDSQVLNRFTNHPNAQIEQLDGPDDFSVYSDLFEYAKSRLSIGRHAGSLEPRNVDCLDLAQSSRGSFLWMSLICDRICGDHSDTKLPERIRTAMLSCPSECSSTESTPPKDDLYLHALRRLFDPRDSTTMGQFRDVMGILLASYHPLSLSDLVEMRDRASSEEDIIAVVTKMDSFLTNATDRRAPLVPFNLSFFEFLRDPHRSQHFFVDVADHHHHRLATRCIRVLSEQLQLNICHLASSYLRNDEVIDLPDRLYRFISPELLYASQFWIEHLCAIEGTMPEALVAEVELLLRTRLFFWLEVLSLIEAVDLAISGLTKILSWSHAAVEAISFVQTFEAAIKTSAPHTYISAIRFWQTEQRERFQPQFRFPEISRSPTKEYYVFTKHREIIRSIAFSPNNRSILSSSDDRIFHTWDISQCVSVSTLTTIPHREGVQHVAFSTDSGSITVVSGGRLQRLDAKAGEILSEFILTGLPDRQRNRDHLDFLFALRPDGERVAVCYRFDGLLSVYDTNASGLISLPDPLQHDKVPRPYERLSSLKYSSQGSFLAIGDSRGRLCLWDAIEGLFAIVIYTGGQIDTMIFSPDEEWLITVEHDPTRMLLHIFDTRTGAELHSFDTTSVPLAPSLRFTTNIDVSPDKKTIALGTAGDKYCPIYFIDVETGESGTPLVVHRGSITCLTFSPDGTMVASGSVDKTVRVCRVLTPFGKHSLWGNGDESGWILGRNNELLLWVPPELKEGFDWTPQIRGEAHGTSWTKCLVEE
ncbi:uncharacterized protein STEHIDRAFT_162217 [Stereum hirsutum FP-91666 SS1]|uniref:uncharacterized protein n=1 Tax=Stereum hirsutum (strain FP-91666) TaxID=721885 RepID=UPI000444A5B2|nr:uncharacterized protein STEHIDRAFT_162217 [Stereum hirsutum FP-91666 SS1]EIM81233.1 hypothetical protein STEHIDRAFT_162217 [Stereum hirsutum FP-91666 SS1]